jgi:hypothetical protein
MELHHTNLPRCSRKALTWVNGWYRIPLINGDTERPNRRVRDQDRRVALLPRRGILLEQRDCTDERGRWCRKS